MKVCKLVRDRQGLKRRTSCAYVNRNSKVLAMTSLLLRCYYIPIYFLVLLWTWLTCLKLLTDLICHPLLFFQRPKRRLTPPQCLLDESLGKHEYVRANGIKFHCVTSGDKSKPLMLFLHGFPEFWYSWRHQLREFSSDYNVVAVDLRGYGDTERPPRRQDYDISHLHKDIVELIPALGYSNAILVAHDWGGVIAWEVARKNPELISKLIVMDIPHPAVLNKFSNSWNQLMKSWYIFMFQVPWLPEFLLSRRNYGYFDLIFRGAKAGVRNKASFPPEAVEAFKYTFSQPGALTAPINYYRRIFTMNNFIELGQKVKAIEVPTLIIWGDEDLFLDPSMADAHQDVVTHLTVRHIPKCSHWAQQDQPELVNKNMREFLGSYLDYALC